MRVEEGPLDLATWRSRVAPTKAISLRWWGVCGGYVCESVCVGGWGGMCVSVCVYVVVGCVYVGYVCVCCDGEGV